MLYATCYMILSPHLIAGAALGAKFNNPYLMPIIAIALHHFMDRLPHYDYKTLPFSTNSIVKISIDVMVGISTITFIYLFFNPIANLTSIISGAFFSALPDGILLLSFIFPKNNLLQKYQKFHGLFHCSPLKTQEFRWSGILVQIIVVIVAAYFLL